MSVLHFLAHFCPVGFSLPLIVDSSQSIQVIKLTSNDKTNTHNRMMQSIIVLSEATDGSSHGFALRYILLHQMTALSNRQLFAYSHFAALNLVQMNKTIQSLTTQIQDFIYEYNLNCYSDPLGHKTIDSQAEFPGYRPAGAARRAAPPKIDGLSEIVMLQQKVVLQVVDRLKLCAHRCQYTPQQPLVEMKKAISHLDQSFMKLADLIVSKEIKRVIDALEAHRHGDYMVAGAVTTMINLGNEHSSQIYGVISKFGGIKSLVGLALPSRSKEVRLLALRAISSICCTVDCIRDLEDANGIDIVADILVSSATCLEARVEAAGVLAQITSPWISDNHKVVGLSQHVPSLVAHLTALSRVRCGEDTFLLVTAALANLTFMEPGAVVAMKAHGTAKTLIGAVQQSPFVSMFAKDQVVTVIANMAANRDCRADIIEEEGMCFLVSLLSTNVESVGTAAEQAAAERVLKKTAIALSRYECVCVCVSVCVCVCVWNFCLLSALNAHLPRSA